MSAASASTGLWDPVRHEALRPIAWNEAHAREMIERIVRDTEKAWSSERHWPLHPNDVEGDDDPAVVATSLDFGAAGVVWALHRLRDIGAARLTRDYGPVLSTLIALNHAWLAMATQSPERERASYLMGDLPILMMQFGASPTASTADAIASLIEGNIDHPARELMWGSPGTLLASALMHRRTGDERWAASYRRTAARLWSQLEWNDEHRCAFWTQDLYGKRTNYIDAVHGFVGTALPLIKGRHLLDEADWKRWQDCIANTIRRTAVRDGLRANWRPWLLPTPAALRKPMFVQYCHGAPGFVINLADFPDASLDELLIAGGATTWSAGPLTKGSNLCHGTGGNGYAFLKLFERTGDRRWLDRARAFAMHGIEQTDADRARFGQLRYSLWTGDLGFAMFLWDCIRERAEFPTLDVFFTAA
ncbi:hypothetical protein BH10PSE17_BH10PSE17_14780 [soil metagenome]